MKVIVFLFVLFCTFSLYGQGNLLVFTGNVDRIQQVTYQVYNPDPAGAPVTVQQIGVEYHPMYPNGDPEPIDLRILFSFWPNNTRNLDNCVRWFNFVQHRELAFNINGQPGAWDGSKSPWPYLQITFAPGTKQIHTFTYPDNQEVWLWDSKDVQCWEVMDWRAPYFPNL